MPLKQATQTIAAAAKNANMLSKDPNNENLKSAVEKNVNNAKQAFKGEPSQRPFNQVAENVNRAKNFGTPTSIHHGTPQGDANEAIWDANMNTQRKRQAENTIDLTSDDRRRLLGVVENERNAYRSDEQKEKDSALLEERSRYEPGYEQYREDFINSNANLGDMLDFNEWSQQQIDNGSWLETEGIENADSGDTATYMNAYMNDPNNPEARAYLEANGYIDPETGEGTWDFYNDYAAFAQDGSNYAKDAWAAWYSDPNIAPSYIEAYGDVIDTDGKDGISRDEAIAYWEMMNAYSPESLDPFTDDEMMQRVFGYSDIGPSVYAMDAWNNYAARDQIITSLLNGTYAEDVEAGIIPQLTDASGKDLVEALGLDRDAEEYISLAGMDPESMSESQLERYDDLYNMFTTGSGNVARWNNALGAAQYGDYKASNPDSNYQIDWGYYDGVPTGLARAAAWGDFYTPEELDQMMREYNQAKGWQGRLNNIAGGDSGYMFISPQAETNTEQRQQANEKAQGIADLIGADYNPQIYYDPESRMSYTDEITGSSEENIGNLTGTSSVSSDYAYLTAQNAGLTDNGWRVIGGGEYVPEYHRATPEANSDLLIAQSYANRRDPDYWRDKMYTDEQIANSNRPDYMRRQNEYYEEQAQQAEERLARWQENIDKNSRYYKTPAYYADMNGGIDYTSLYSGEGLRYNNGAIYSNGYLRYPEGDSRRWNVGA